MSDGMTEGARDLWRAEAETAFLASLADHVACPSDATWTRLLEDARRTDDVRGGNFSGPTDWSRRVHAMVGPLLGGDRTTWARLLHGMLAADARSLSHGTGERLKDLSPFAGKALVTSDGSGLGGETHDVLARAMANADVVQVGARHHLAVVDLDGAPYR